MAAALPRKPEKPLTIEEWGWDRGGLLVTSHVYPLAFLGQASVRSRGDCGVRWDVDATAVLYFPGMFNALSVVVHYAWRAPGLACGFYV